MVTRKNNVVDIPKVAIVILNWNGKDDTCECIESVQKIDYPSYQIIVVDNGSIDDSVATIRASFPQIHLIENGSNLGYAAGNNPGIAYAISSGTDYILILNNDAIVAPDIITKFVKTSIDNPKAGILGAIIYFYEEPNKIWFAGGRWLPESATFSHLSFCNQDIDSELAQAMEIDYACGCAMFFKSEVIQEIGYLDSRYFLTWEETDFCYRARRAGFKCILADKAYVWHKISASFKGGEEGLMHLYFMTRNRLLWMEQNVSSQEIFRFYTKILWPDVNYYIRVYFSKKSNVKDRIKAQVNLTAIKDYFLRRFGDCPSWVRSI